MNKLERLERQREAQRRLRARKKAARGDVVRPPYVRPRAESPSVYFVTDELGHVKIGVAVDVALRVADMQVGNASALTIVATVPGDETLERHLHERFAAYRVRGEWFKLVPDIERYIERSA